MTKTEKMEWNRLYQEYKNNGWKLKGEKLRRFDELSRIQYESYQESEED